MGALSKLKGPLVLLVLLVVPALFWDDMLKELGSDVFAQTQKVAWYALSTALWLALAWLVVRLIDVLFWEGLVAPRLGGSEHVPKLLKDVVAVVVFVIAISGILGVVFDMNVTGLWATSGVVGLVVGLALQSMIADVFSGIALNIDRPFRVGDWVTLHRRGLEPLTGCIREVNWRSTRVEQKDGVLVVVPNNLVSTMILTNLSQPKDESRFRLRFCLDFHVPPERALRILSAGAKAAKGPLADPAPKVRIAGTSKWGVEYEVRYWLNPAEVSPSRGRHAISASVLDHLHHAGLTLAYEKQDLYVAPMPQRQLDTRADKMALLSRIELFEQLEQDELEQLSEAVSEREMGERKNVVTQGDKGTSMFLLVEGLLHVLAKSEVDDEGEDVLVGAITPGQFFGEMSLLTGEPRSATVQAATDCVMYEITKEHLEPLLVARPEIAEQITSIVAERKVRMQQRHEAHRDEDKAAEDAEGLANQLLGKMRKLFGLSKKPTPVRQAAK